MTSTLLRESVKDAPVKSGNLWRVIVARPGKGSSGTYSAEVFKRDAQKMLPKGAQSFINHDERRDPKDMIGVFESGGAWSEEDQAVVAELKVFEHWKPFVEELAPHVGISLYAMGEMDDDGNVTAFIEDAYNGADLVARPGLTGSGFDQKLYEAARSASDETRAEASAKENRKDDKMDEKAIEAINALTAKVTALVSAQTAQTEAQAQVEANEEAIEEAREQYASAIEAIESARADLLPSQVKYLMAEAKAGVDVVPLIEQAKTVATEALAEATGSRVIEGRIVGSSPTEVKFTGFGGSK